MRQPSWAVWAALLLVCHGAAGTLIPWGSTPGSWEPWLQLDLLATNNLRCADFYATADTAFRSAFVREVNRKLRDDAIVLVSTDCQVSMQAAPGRRGGSTILPQKRLRIRGKLLSSTEEGDMRHFLAVFEAMHIHKQIIHEIAHTLPAGSAWEPDALFYSSPLEASLCVGGMWTAGARLQIGKPCPADGQAWSPGALVKACSPNEACGATCSCPAAAPHCVSPRGQTVGQCRAAVFGGAAPQKRAKRFPPRLIPAGKASLILANYCNKPVWPALNGQWANTGVAPVGTRTQGYVFGPADSSDKNLWPLGPSGGPNFRLASFAGKNPASDVPAYTIIDLSNVAKWGGINGMTVWPRTGCGTNRNRGFGMPTNSTDFSCEVGDCWSNDPYTFNKQTVIGGARDGSCMWQNKATSAWVQTGGVAPKPLVEFTFAVQTSGDNNGKALAYYDMSAVDGYVDSIAVYVGSGIEPDKKNVTRFSCGNPVCDYNIAMCPPELRLYNSAGTLIGCMSISSAIDRMKEQKSSKYIAAYKKYMVQLRTNALQRSLAQCSCVHNRMAPNHPAFDCALDAPGANGGYEDALINKPPRAPVTWKPNYVAAAAALALNHTTATKPTRENLGFNIESPKPITATGFCCSPYITWYYGPHSTTNKPDQQANGNNEIIKQHMCNDTNIPTPWDAGWQRPAADRLFMEQNYKGKKYHEIFKGMCSDAYSWQFDDLSSTYECVVGAQTSFVVEFC